MEEIIISDTSCLIALDRIDSLHLLHETFSCVITTPEIEKEFGLKLPDWINIRKSKNESKIKDLETTVDKGEASAIALAMETPDCILIIDEKKGRELARRLHIKIMGTLKVILLAKRKGIILKVKPLIEKLQNSNFRMEQKIITAIIREAGEE